MTIWFLSFLAFFLGLKLLCPQGLTSVLPGGAAQQRKVLQKVTSSLQEIEETLTAGLVPSPQTWAALKQLPHPWGNLSFESLEGLRSSGGSLLPTLKRLRLLADEQNQALGMAQAKSSQAFYQAIACSFLVPILGFALYALLPSLQECFRSWLFAVGLALAMGGVGSLWLMRMVDSARWAGVRLENRPWILSSQCAGERFLALVRTGQPPDLAWIKACQLLSTDSMNLAAAWGSSVWEIPSRTGIYGAAEQSILGVGNSIRKAIQISLMEGRPCAERVETVLTALRTDMRTHMEKELTLLSTRALKPLFVCIAPALLGLLTFGIWIVASESMQGSLGAF